MIFIAVDDEPMVLGVLVNALKEAEPDCETFQFEKSREAIEALEQGLRPDAAFLDIEMFDMNGLELAGHIREISHNTKIVFITGHSQYALEAYAVHAMGYLLKPVTAVKVRAELMELKTRLLPAGRRIRVQTFGNFEIFADEKPLRFTFAKTKELLAYLVDRCGAAVNTGELCAVLWEEKSDSRSTRSYLRTLIADLRHSLAEADASDLLIKSRNRFTLNCKKMDCDLHRLLLRDADAINAYMGEYMTQYSWAEPRVSNLQSNKNKSEKCK